MRAALLQIDVHPDETVETRRSRVAALVSEQSEADLVVLPELWTCGAFAYDEWEAAAEPLAGPTAEAMAAAARRAGAWLHAGSIVERAAADAPGARVPPVGGASLYNTSLLFDPAGELRSIYRKIHRFGFDRGEAVVMGGGREIVTAATPYGTLGLATCYDLRFPEQFRMLVDAGAELLVVPAGWPARRREHWRLLVRARAVESQAFVLACCEAGTHAGVPQAGHSMVVDPWGDILSEAGPEESVLTADLDPAQVTKTRASFPVLHDRVLPLRPPSA